MVTGPVAFLGISSLSIEVRLRHTVNGVPCLTTHVYAFNGDDFATRPIHMYRPMDIKFSCGSPSHISSRMAFYLSLENNWQHRYPQKSFVATSVMDSSPSNL